MSAERPRGAPSPLGGADGNGSNALLMITSSAKKTNQNPALVSLCAPPVLSLQQSAGEALVCPSGVLSFLYDFQHCCFEARGKRSTKPRTSCLSRARFDLRTEGEMCKRDEGSTHSVLLLSRVGPGLNIDALNP